MSPAASRSVDEFRRVVAAVKGARSLRREALAAEPTPGPAGADENFSLLGGGIRWQEADTGAAIAWYRNPAAPSPLASGDTDGEIQLALSAWTSVETARIVLAFGGPAPTVARPREATTARPRTKASASSTSGTSATPCRAVSSRSAAGASIREALTW